MELKLDNKTTCLVHIGLSYSSDVIVMLISTLFTLCFVHGRSTCHSVYLSMKSTISGAYILKILFFNIYFY